MDSILVEDVYRLYGKTSASIQIPEDAPSKRVVTAFANDACLQTIFLVDPDQRFAGVITRTTLLKWAICQLNGEARREVSISDIIRLVSATKARDLSVGGLHRIGVKTHDTLSNALRQMIVCEIDAIPVLDDEARIIGDMILAEVLLRALQDRYDSVLPDLRNYESK